MHKQILRFLLLIYIYFILIQKTVYKFYHFLSGLQVKLIFKELLMLNGLFKLQWVSPIIKMNLRRKFWFLVKFEIFRRMSK